MRNILASIILLITQSVFAQDNYSGTWNLLTQGMKMELKIGAPENNLAYPAQLTVTSDSFHGIYHILLAKKNYRELFISRQKYAVSEIPFSMGDAINLLTGVLNFQKDLKGNLLLNLKKISNQKSINLSSIQKNISEIHQVHFLKILKILQSDSISFQKTNNNIPVDFDT